MSDGIKMNVSNGQGLIHTLKKYLKEKDGKDYEIKGDDYVNVMKEFIKINNNRKTNGQNLIFRGGENYNGGSGQANFIINPGDLEFTEDEVKGLYSAMGLEFKTTSEKTAEEIISQVAQQPTAEANPKATQQPVTVTENNPQVSQQPTADKETKTQVPQQPATTTETKPQVPQQPAAETGNKPQSAQQTTIGNYYNGIPQTSANNTAAAQKTQTNPKTKTPTFDLDAYYDKIDKAKISADVVKAETDAYKAGAQLKEAATQVDLKGLNKFGKNETWNSSVDEYFSDNKNSVLNRSVKGAEYDSDKRSVKDRVVQGETQKSPTLQQEIKDKGVEAVIKAETEIDLKNVAGLDLTKIQNIKKDATSEEIEKTAQQLEDASKEIKEAQKKVNEKTNDVKKDIAEQNSRIDTQIDEINAHKRVIAKYLEVEKNDPFLKEYNENKAEIDGKNHDNYEKYGKYQYAREAKDKQILSQYVKNIKVVNGKWDLSGIKDTKQKAEAENALNRLSKKYPDIETQVKNIGDACKQIEEARKIVVDGLKKLAQYQVVQNYLDDVTKDLTAKSKELKNIYENLEQVDEFIEFADGLAADMLKKEQKRADKAKAAADKKAGVTSNKSDKSRAELNTDDKANPAKATKKAEKDAKKAVKAAEETVGKTKKYQQRQAIVNQYERAVFDLNEAKKLYTTGKAAQEKTNKAEITSKNDLPENLQANYSKLQNKFKGCDVTFIYQNNEIIVKDNKTGKNVAKVDSNTDSSYINLIDITNVSKK